MRLRPHTLCLMALRGRTTIYGRALPSKEEARERLREITGQDFGDDAEKWGQWLRKNRKAINQRARQEGNRD